MMLLTPPRADRVVLHDISWQQFENLLVNLGESRAARMAYDRGTLEIIKPLLEHEYYKETIGDAVKDIAEVLEEDYETSVRDKIVSGEGEQGEQGEQGEKNLTRDPLGVIAPHSKSLIPKPQPKHKQPQGIQGLA